MRRVKMGENSNYWENQSIFELFSSNYLKKSCRSTIPNFGSQEKFK